MPTSTDDDFTKDRIEKYILYCKLRSENRTHRNSGECFTQEYSRCLERYYTICLRDVNDHNIREPCNRKNISICEKIIDTYLNSVK
jgi:hypothetical protein